MRNKTTNFELLRIILTLFIPIYHWLLYNGIFYADNSSNNLLSLVFFSGIPFSCLYAFIAMSGYFLLEKKFVWNLKKIYSFIALCITLFLFKTIIINGLFPGPMMNYFVDTFFLKGAWWYVYPYILLMIFYPLLNYFIYTFPKPLLYLSTALFGILYLISGITNDTNFFNDCFMFLFIYFIMGCIKRCTFVPSFYQKHKTTLRIFIYILCVATITIVSIYLKLPENGLSLAVENDIFQRLHTRYTLLGLISGITLFQLAKDMSIPYIPAIHRISKITLFVFLLHETVMCVFWAFEIKSCEFLAYLPMGIFFGLLLLYMVLCIFCAALMAKLYDSLFAPLWNKLIEKLYDTSFSRYLEKIYQKLERKAKYV